MGLTGDHQVGASLLLRHLVVDFGLVLPHFGNAVRSPRSGRLRPQVTPTSDRTVETVRQKSFR